MLLFAIGAIIVGALIASAFSSRKPTPPALRRESAWPRTGHGKRDDPEWVAKSPFYQRKDS